MRYLVHGYKKYTGNLQEGNVQYSYSGAYAEALNFLRSEQYRVIVILRDSQGNDHPANTGKFFLHRIIK